MVCGNSLVWWCVVIPWFGDAWHGNSLVWGCGSFFVFGAVLVYLVENCGNSFVWGCGNSLLSAVLIALFWAVVIPLFGDVW